MSAKDDEVTVTYRFWSGALKRGWVRSNLEHWLELTPDDVKATLTEYHGWLRSEWLFTLEGPEGVTMKFSRKIDRLAREAGL